MSRLAYERAIRRSALPSPSRHLALTLATWADIATGVIPPRFMPSLSTLEAATGLTRKTVRAHLDRLEDDGWVDRDRPTETEARRGARTQYRLTIPAGLGDQGDAEGRGEDPPPSAGVGDNVPQGGGSPPPGKWSTSPSARGGDPPKSDESSGSTYQSPRAGARERTPSISEQLDAAAEAARVELGRAVRRTIAPSWARRVAMGILDASRGPVDDPARYVAAAIRRAPDLSRFLPTPTPGGTGAEAFLDDTPAPPPPSTPSMETAECGHERVVGDTAPCWVCSQT